ncbi:MAG TPA: flavin reductase family protein [Gaiellaceae bacterium]|jgi:flavin reductase (DIM6/NTAB) family NADH-FMN oxidoreductase RutF|nr:flavin reductase family protein [Gaiellaceae bacterium]
MILDPAELERQVLNGLMNGLVAPRPIAWVSTIGTDGRPNLAPFSFFNAFSFHPFPTVGIGPGARAGIDKDTLRNVRETGELTISTVDERLAERANASSAEFGPEVDEWQIAGVTPAPSVLVAPPRVAESPAAFECRIHEIVDLGSAEMPSNALVIARVVRIYVRDDCVDADLRPRSGPLALVGRMAGNDWVRTRDRFELERPVSIDPDEVARTVQGGR